MAWNMDSGKHNDMFHHGSGCMNFCSLGTKDTRAQMHSQRNTGGDSSHSKSKETAPGSEAI